MDDMAEIDAKVTVTVCTTCRAGAPTDAEGPRPGARLHDALSGALPDHVRIRPVECLSACSRGCSMVIEGGAERWTYIYGDMDPDTHVPAIVEGVTAYAATTDGVVPWRERPEIFRKQSIARIPPQAPQKSTKEAAE
ncbi:DUF1636 family protein [Aliiroseovarius sp.]|uniref:DUF1636 family protein n=1 Tax=Aliiroseovarius sp. TaxID=1872442 RepID=UPI003BAD083D